MRTYLDKNEQRALTWTKRCGWWLLVMTMLVTGGCTINALRENFRVRAAIPPALEPSLYVSVQVCDRLMGGHSYMARVSPAALTRLNRDGPGFLSYGVRDRTFRPPWQRITGMKWDANGAPAGLACLRKWTVDGKPLHKHLFCRDGYMRAGSSLRQADYIVPSLGIIVGGFNPR